MTLQEAIKSNRPFRVIGAKTWLIVNKENNEIITKNSNSPVKLTATNILLNYEIQEQWYEGNFKKKWPNGVLCKVGDNIKYHQIFAIVVDYIPDSQNPFLTINNTLWKSAEPIKPEEAPAIIKI